MSGYIWTKKATLSQPGFIVTSTTGLAYLGGGAYPDSANSLSSFLPSLHQRSFQPPPSLLMVDDLVRQCANFVMAYRLTGCLKVIDYIQTFVSPKIVICLTLVINFEYYTINLYVIKYLLTPFYMLGLAHHNHEICKC